MVGINIIIATAAMAIIGIVYKLISDKRRYEHEDNPKNLKSIKDCMAVIRPLNDYVTSV